METPKKNYTEEEKVKDPKTPTQREEQKDPQKKDREYNLDHESNKGDSETGK